MKTRICHLRTIKNRQYQGFTLIEVMLVIVLIGIMVSSVQFSFSSSKPEQLLQQSSARFAGIFDVAAEYGMLNNIELGLYIDENTYQFLGYDGVRWSPIADKPVFEAFTLPEGVEVVLQLDDLPIEDVLLFDPTLLNNEDDESLFEKEGEEKKIIPQVYILSGGDITPFSLTFELADFSFDKGEDVIFKVTGIYTVPLTIEGPLENANRR